MHTADQREIDLLLAVAGELWALEVKLTTGPRPADFARLNATADLVGANRRILVCQQCDRVETEAHVVCDVQGLAEFIAGRAAAVA